MPFLGYSSAAVTASTKIAATTFADGTVGTNLETSAGGSGTMTITTGLATGDTPSTTDSAFIRTTSSIAYASPLPRYHVRVDAKHGDSNSIVGNTFRLLQLASKWTVDTIANYDAKTPCYAEYRSDGTGHRSGYQGSAKGTFNNGAEWTNESNATPTRVVIYEWCDGTTVYTAIRKQSDGSNLANTSWAASSVYKPDTTNAFWFAFGDGANNWGAGKQLFYGITVCADTRVTVAGLVSGSGQKVKVYNSANSTEIGATTGTESSGSTTVEMFPTSSSTAPLDFTDSGQNITLRIYQSDGTTLINSLSLSNVYPGDTITAYPVVQRGLTVARQAVTRAATR